MNHFGQFEKIRSATLEQLQQVPDIGPVVAESIFHFFQQRHNNEVIDSLMQKGVHWDENDTQEAHGSKPLQGTLFCHYRNAFCHVSRRSV